MKTWVYSWVVYPVGLLIAYFFSFFSQKLRRSLRLRWWLRYLGLRFHAKHSVKYWVHVASVGELEYAIPFLKSMAENGEKAVVTYYSISAKDAVDRLPGEFPSVALVNPIPHDGLGLMKSFVGLLKAQGVEVLLLMKYELWPGLLWESQRFGLKVVLVNALRPGVVGRALLHKVALVLPGYAQEFEGIRPNRGSTKIVVCGDTRVARVLDRIQNLRSASSLQKTVNTKSYEKLTEKSKKNLDEYDQACRKDPSFKLRLVSGSMWDADTKLFCDLMENNNIGQSSVRDFVWVPHEVPTKQTSQILKGLRNPKCFINEVKIICDDLMVEQDIEVELQTLREKSGHVSNNRRTLWIVLAKGFLVELYRDAHISFVGGGFEKMIHSVWEPFLAGSFVACGPNRSKSPESFYLERLGALMVLPKINPMEAFEKWILLNTSDLHARNALHQNILARAISDHGSATQAALKEIRALTKSTASQDTHVHAQDTKGENFNEGSHSNPDVPS